MPDEHNSLGQLIGPAVENWRVRSSPPRAPIEGVACRLEPLDPERHTADLYERLCAGDGQNWTYLSFGPFDNLPAFRGWVTASALSADFFFAVIDKATGKAAGVAALLRVDRVNGAIEIGHIHFSPELRRSRAATETIFLLLKTVFDQLGYRRCEWKCNALNQASRNAALRLGFQFEGIFRQAVVVKGRNRDTSWYSIIDSEWPLLRPAYEKWLAADNFGPEGEQLRPLSAFMPQRG